MLEIRRTDPAKIHEYEYHMEEGVFTYENSRAVEVIEKLPHGEVSSVGIMYVVKMWRGVGTTHAYLGPHVWGKNSVRMVRQVARELDKAAEELKLWRVQAESPYSAPRYSRWLTLLGFKLEAELKMYYPDKENVWILTKFYERD